MKRAKKPKKRNKVGAQHAAPTLSPKTLRLMEKCARLLEKNASDFQFKLAARYK